MYRKLYLWSLSLVGLDLGTIHLHYKVLIYKPYCGAGQQPVSVHSMHIPEPRGCLLDVISL